MVGSVSLINFGLSKEAFRNDYFEKHPYLATSALDVAGYDWSLIDAALDLQEPSRERLKVLRHGRIEPRAYTEEYVDIGIRRTRIVKAKLYDLLEQGATIVLNRAELVSEAIEALCMQVGSFVGTQTTVNAYASLGAVPATNVHWDTHDVFVLQLSGRKHWRIYEPTLPLPFVNQISNERKGEVSDVPFMDHMLEAGSILYVPRGWWHKVEPTQDRDSIHLTVAIHSPMMLDYLIWACSTSLPEHLPFRRAMLGRPEEGANLKEALSLVTSLLSSPEMIDAFHGRAKERERSVSPFAIQGLLATASAPLPDDAIVSINSKSAGHAAAGQPITINGVRVASEGKDGLVLNALAESGPITVQKLREQMGELTVQSADQILRRLARNEWIRISKQGTSE